MVPPAGQTGVTEIRRAPPPYPPSPEAKKESTGGAYVYATERVVADWPREELPEEQDWESLPVYTNVTASREVARRERLAETPEIGVVREVRRPSRVFAELTVRKKVREMLSLLEDLKMSLGKPEGAAVMTVFRKRFGEVWEVKDALPKPRVLLLSAVEEVIRARKWRELTTAQIDLLERSLSGVGDDTFTPKRLDEALKAIHKSGMDIYPSSEVDENDKEE